MGDKNRTVLVRDNQTRLVRTEDNSNQTKVVRGNDFYYNEDLNTQENLFLKLTKELFKETYNIAYNTMEERDLNEVKRDIHQEMDRFINSIGREGGDRNYIKIASYMMCTFCDELIANSNWATNYHWAEVSLLNHYHQESYGGDKFFQLLSRFMQKPVKYIDLLELAFVSLSFGFGGRYKQQNRMQELNMIREEVYQQIKHINPTRDRFYKGHPSATKVHRLYSKLSDIVIVGIVVAIMLLIYGAFTYRVNSNESSIVKLLEEEQTTMDNRLKATYGR